MNIRILFLLFGAFGLCHAQTCNETTESTFQIDFAIAREEFDDFLWYLQLESDLSRIPILSEEYFFFDDVPTNTTIHCIPKEECVVLRVSKLRPEQYTIQVDGQVITPGPSFPYRVYRDYITFSLTELGGCIPTCGEGEALFELAALTGRNGEAFDWILEDFATRQVLAECLPRSLFSTGACFWRSWDLYHSRRCLPVDSCYRLIVGNKLRVAVGELREQPLFNITFDGEDIASLQGPQFDTVEFGGGCSAHCSRDETLLEFFLFRYIPLHSGISWSFKGGEDTLLEGVIAGKNTTLQYIHKCVKTDACISFSASVPENHQENGRYHLSLNRVIFVDTYYEFGGFDASQEETATLGECSAADLCDIEAESLFYLQLETGGDGPFDLTWQVEYVDKMLRLRKGRIAGSGIHGGYLPGFSYRTYQCIPKTNCTRFEMQGDDIADGAVFNYNISIDGSIIDSHDCTDSRCIGVEDIVTRLGGDNCPSSDLSTGAIVGIVVGSVAGLAVLALLAFKLIKGRKRPATPPVASKGSSVVDPKEDKETFKKEETDGNKLEDVAL